MFGNEQNDPRFKGLSSSSKNGVTTIKGYLHKKMTITLTIQADKITYDRSKTNKL